MPLSLGTQRLIDTVTPDSQRKELAGRADVTLVTVTEYMNQVLLFVVHADDDISRHTQRQQQVPNRHHRGKPDADKYAGHDGVANVAV